MIQHAFIQKWLQIIKRYVFNLPMFRLLPRKWEELQRHGAQDTQGNNLSELERQHTPSNKVNINYNPSIHSDLNITTLCCAIRNGPED